MVACARCGAFNPSTARFCGACGNRVPASPGGEREVRKIVTTLFCDVTGSTSIGERLDPESLRRVMITYYEHMGRVVAAHGGTVEKFIGDAVMAVFGVPEVHEDDALRAVTAAVEMHGELARLNDQLERDWGVRLQARIGVNTGEVLAGDASGEHALVTGDPVNISARLEQAAEPGDVLIGRGTYDFVRDAIQVEPVGPLHLKGKDASVEAFRVLQVVPGAPGRVRRVDVPLVDRHPELGLVQAAFRRAVERRRVELVAVVGEAGVGKSRLVAESLAPLSELALVMHGRSREHAVGSPFNPLGEAIRHGLGLAADASPGELTARLESAVQGTEHAELIVRWVAPVLGGGGAEATVDDTAWATRKLLETLAEARPLVVVLDDLHWAEPALLDLVDHVVSWSRDAPILLLCAGRPELRGQRPWWSEPRSYTTAISLDPLSNADASLLVHRLLPGGQVAERASNRVIQAAEGNPLFIEELLEMLVDEGLLRQEAGTWVPAVALSQLPTPRTLESLLMARIDQLGVRDAGILQRASVIGVVFGTSPLVGILPAEERADVPKGLVRAVSRDLIRAEPAGFLGGEAFRFRHALVRDAAYGMLTRHERAVLHERFATWLERAADESAVEYEEVLAHHLEAAYRNRVAVSVEDDHARQLASRAAAFLASGGRRALAREDVRAASALLARAVELIGPDNPRRAELLLDLGDSQRRAGLLSEAHATLTGAMSAASTGGDVGLVTRILVCDRRVKLLTDPGAVEEAFADARRAIAEFERLGDDRGLAQAWQLVALIEWDRGRVSATEEALKRALRHARAAGDEQEEAFDLGSLMSVALFGPTPVAEGVRLCNDALKRTGARHILEGRILRAMGGLRAMQGEFESARTHVDRSIEIFEDFGQPEWISAALQVRGFIERLAGDAAAAQDALRRSYDLLRSGGDTTHLAMGAALLAHAVHALGRGDEAEELTRVSEKLAAAGDLDAQSHWRTARAKVLVQRGELGQAVELARHAVRLGRGSEMHIYADILTDAAGIVAAAGAGSEAVELLEDALVRYERKGDVVSAGRARAQLAIVARAAE